MITLIVMASVMMLLQKLQTTFQREPEVADMNQSARTGLDMISRDLTMPGLNTPSATAIMWTDGGGDNPDEITIIYADPDIPTVTPLMCKAPGPPGPGCDGGPCKTVENSATLFVAPERFRSASVESRECLPRGPSPLRHRVPGLRRQWRRNERK